jgi:GxxExxY protein
LKSCAEAREDFGAPSVAETAYAPALDLVGIRTVRAPLNCTSVPDGFSHGAALALTLLVQNGGDLTGRIIACAIEVHRALGPGLRERTYEEALALELLDQHVPFERQVRVPVQFKGQWVGDYCIDFVVNNLVIVEVKSVERFEPLFEAQVLGYLRASGLHLALLVNFNSHRVTEGIRRYIR